MQYKGATSVPRSEAINGYLSVGVLVGGGTSTFRYLEVASLGQLGDYADTGGPACPLSS